MNAPASPAQRLLEIAASEIPWIANVGAHRDAFQPADVRAHSGAPLLDRVLFTRSILRRNFAGFPFWVSASPEVCAVVAARAREHAAAQGYHAGYVLSECAPETLGLFRERHWLPEQPAAFPGKRGFKTLFLGSDPSDHAWLGETEHWAAVRVRPGLPEIFPGIETAGSGGAAEPGRGEPFSRSAAYGFLTSDPSFAGTGLQFEAGLHLPALSAARRTPQIQQAMGAMGLELQPLMLRVPGLAESGFFRLVSRGGMDLSSEALYRRFADKASALLGAETEAFESWRTRESRQLEDRVHRSLRLLQEARLLPYGELLAFSSFARIGAYSGLFPASLPGVLETLRVRTQPRHLAALHPGSAPEDADSLRAEAARTALKSVAPAA